MNAFRNWQRISKRVFMIALLCCGCIAAAALVIDAVWPVQSGEIMHAKNGFTIDASHAEDGYFMAKRDACSSTLKLRVTKGNATYTYDLNSNGEYEVFPLQMGSGTYSCELYKCVKSNKYSKEAKIEMKIELSDENAAFLCPSQYVNYDQESLAVAKSIELCENLETDQEKLDAIVQFVAENFAYDYDRAASNPGFYLGDVEGCFEERIGLCQDLAAMTAAMLRVQGIPTQMVIGYADRYYHAWNKVLIDDEYQLLDITAKVTGVPASTYTEERRY